MLSVSVYVSYIDSAQHVLVWAAAVAFVSRKNLLKAIHLMYNVYIQGLFQLHAIELNEKELISTIDPDMRTVR